MDAYQRIFDERGGEVVADRLKDIRCPLLVIHGDKDAMLDPVHPEHLSNNIKGAKLHRLGFPTMTMTKNIFCLSRFPDGKHNLHLKYAKDFNKMVSDFFLE